MSAFIKAPFGQVAPYLADYGFRPVPIKRTFKAPMIDGWQAGHPPGHYLPHRNPETGALTNCASWGTGLLTEFTPGVDLDIKDRELVRVLLDVAYEVLGPTPFRVGAPPKVLLPYSTTAPFDKISGRWWALPGEDFRAASYSPHRIETLGRGQQFVCYAKHPRGSYYRWRRGCPMDTLLVDLPEIDETAAKGFLATAEAILEDIGAIPLRRENKVWRPNLAQPETTFRRPKLSDGPINSEWQRLDPETLAKKIDPTHARPLCKNGGWICSCPAHTSEGHRSLSITKRDGGGSIVHCFGECSFPEIAREIATIVGAA
jgi:hypothetical protein